MYLFDPILRDFANDTYPTLSSRLNWRVEFGQIRGSGETKDKNGWLERSLSVDKRTMDPLCCLSILRNITKVKEKDSPPQHLYTLCRLKKFLCPEGSDSGSFFFSPLV